MSGQRQTSGKVSIPASDLFRVRLVLGIFFGGLILSGVTAFPLSSELNLLARLLGAEQLAISGGPFTGLGVWIITVRAGLRATDAAFPFIAYGTDWLAFGHIVIALFFIGPMIDPVRNVFILHVGLWACVLVLPLALICGPIRGIPFYWRLVDCSFGIFAFPLLWYCLRLARRLEISALVTTRSDGR